jgi:hypothetical protein
MEVVSGLGEGTKVMLSIPSGGATRLPTHVHDSTGS